MLKPKRIYLVCFYDKQYIVKAAKELKIEVIDIQHGIIGKEHSAYFSSLLLSDIYLPDKLYSFGESEKEYFIDSGIVSTNNIIPIGNYYLEYIKNNFVQDDKLFKT